MSPVRPIRPKAPRVSLEQETPLDLTTVEVHRETTPEPQRRLAQHMTALEDKVMALTQQLINNANDNAMPLPEPREINYTNQPAYVTPYNLQAPFQAPYYYQGPDGYTFTQQPWYAGPVAPAVPSDHANFGSSTSVYPELFTPDAPPPSADTPSPMKSETSGNEEVEEYCHEETEEHRSEEPDIIKTPGEAEADDGFDEEEDKIDWAWIRRIDRENRAIRRHRRNSNDSVDKRFTNDAHYSPIVPRRTKFRYRDSDDDNNNDWNAVTWDISNNNNAGSPASWSDEDWD